MSAEGVNDYAITDPAEAFTYSEDTTLNLVFSKKPTYGVKIALGSTPDLSSKNVVFIFKHSEGDVYSLHHGDRHVPHCQRQGSEPQYNF